MNGRIAVPVAVEQLFMDKLIADGCDGSDGTFVLPVIQEGGSGVQISNFARLKKDKVFWIGIAFMFAAGIFGVIQKLLNDPKASPDQLFFIFPVIIGVAG